MFTNVASPLKKVHIVTYGCQMNVYDSNKIHDSLLNLGYKITDSLEDASLFVMNTCNIREKAVEKMYSELGKVREIKELRLKNKQQMIMVVAGCVGQAEGEEIFKRAPFVDIIVGPQSYHTLPKLIEEVEEKNVKMVNLDFKEFEKFDHLPGEFSTPSVSAFLTIQEGCDKFCKFCSVPYTRGTEYSRSAAHIYREALALVSKGTREITLLGQNVNAYHGIGENGSDCTLAQLITMLAAIKGLERIRYTTSHPVDMSDDLIELHGTEPKLMPFLHLPVQSGSDKLLHTMNRRHDTKLYYQIIDRLRKARPDIAFSTDIIFGYPGETDEDFEQTLELARNINFASVYSFKYSKRPGTPATMLNNQVDEDIKHSRLTKGQSLFIEQQIEFNKSFIGKIVQVLIDRKVPERNQMTGKTPHMQNVYVNNIDDLYGQLIDVLVTEASQTHLKGNILNYNAKAQ